MDLVEIKHGVLAIKLFDSQYHTHPDFALKKNYQKMRQKIKLQ